MALHTHSKVERAMREVHKNIPSTVKRARHFGPGGKEAMLRAIVFSKARKLGAKIPKKPNPSIVMAELKKRKREAKSRS